MTEQEARAWLDARGWWKGALGDRLRNFVDLVLFEADKQNLISAGSRAHIWSRHVVDSLQLIELLPSATRKEGLWVDLGTGAGFPGLAVACIRHVPIQLIESRPLRVDFLQRSIATLGLGHATVVGTKVERVSAASPAKVISARALAPLDRLLAVSSHLSDEDTIWLLPKGRQSEKELDVVRPKWHATFHVEHSITDPESNIVTISQLRPRANSTNRRNLRKKHR
jgi:16S rRNA (guanine527-N7)-methyltransferase